MMQTKDGDENQDSYKIVPYAADAMLLNVFRLGKQA
jgi:hypothetical protein